MKKIKLLAWVAYLALLLLAVACSDDDEKDPTPEVYSITVTAAANGTVTADPATCEAGETVTLTATPDEGFLFVKWTVTGGEVTLADATANPVKITMPRGNVAIEASFAEEIIPYALTLATVENGTIAADAGEAPEGKPVTLTATPAAGYDFIAWTVEGAEIAETELAKNPLTFPMPANEVRVSAAFRGQINVLDKITDPTFKAYALHCMEHAEEGNVDGATVKQPMWDLNLDGKLSEKEATAVQFLDLNRFYNETAGELGVEVGGITSLAGIEYFTGIKRLDISEYVIDTEGMELNLTNCKELVEFAANDCGYGLSKIILGGKPGLKLLDLTACWDLTGIDLDNCPKLEELILKSDYMEQIDLSGLPALKKLNLMLSGMESIDLSANTELTSLIFTNCSDLKTLDISRQNKLTSLNCTGCQLSVVDITKMAFNEDGTYTAFVGNQGTRKNPLNLNELRMRADQKKHWDEVLTVGSTNQSRNSRITNVTVIE